MIIGDVREGKRMKCWECKQQVTGVHIAHYYSPIQDKEATREVCPECYKKLEFDPCHYVEVRKISQRSLDTEKARTAIQA